jgi:hypothetical protein
MLADGGLPDEHRRRLTRLVGGAEKELRHPRSDLKKSAASLLKSSPFLLIRFLPQSCGAGRQLGSGGLTGRRTGVLRSFVPILLL